MPNKRDELIKRNQEFVQIPMPDFSKMTDDELQKRANMMERAFRDAFNEPDDEDDDL
uniref:hypothetical protein n=1 Tax=uncultured Allobacillus sp. TaxID=1638025 RepID=UPI002597D7C8|nr:hypothetical protein [uncultured Allobacillus sp.]